MPDLIVKVGATLEVLLSSLNKEQNVWQSAYCVLVTSHHHVCKSDVVTSRDVTRWNLRVHWLQQNQGWCELIVTVTNSTCLYGHKMQLTWLWFSTVSPFDREFVITISKWTFYCTTTTQPPCHSITIIHVQYSSTHTVTRLGNLQMWPKIITFCYLVYC